MVVMVRPTFPWRAPNTLDHPCPLQVGAEDDVLKEMIKRLGVDILEYFQDPELPRQPRRADSFTEL